MMLAMFLQSSRKKEKTFRWSRFRSYRPEKDISGSDGNIASIGLGWVILGLQEAQTQCFSVP